jgi:hypothetical protein
MRVQAVGAGARHQRAEPVEGGCGGRFTVGGAVALLQAATWYVGDDGDTGSLQTWQTKLLWVIGISLIIAAGYTLFPKREPEKEPAGSR